MSCISSNPYKINSPFNFNVVPDNDQSKKALELQTIKYTYEGVFKCCSMKKAKVYVVIIWPNYNYHMVFWLYIYYWCKTIMYFMMFFNDRVQQESVCWPEHGYKEV